MQRLEVSDAVRPIYGSSGVKRLKMVGYNLLFICSDQATSSSRPRVRYNEVTDKTYTYTKSYRNKTDMNNLQKKHYIHRILRLQITVITRYTFHTSGKEIKGSHLYLEKVL